MCQPCSTTRSVIALSSSIGVKSTRRLMKLKRTPRTPASCSRFNSASGTSRRTVAIPRARPSLESNASTIALLSAPWQVACTITLRSKPRRSRNANNCALLASQGVYLRSGAYGNSAPGPNTWQCASTAPRGSAKLGLLGPSYQSSQPFVFSNGPVTGLPTSFKEPSVDIFEPRLFERLAHLVHVEAQHAGGELQALVALVGFARRSGLGRLSRPFGRHDDHSVIVGDDRIARIDRSAGADDRNIDRAQGRLHRSLGADALAPYRKAHLGQSLHVAHAGVDDEGLGAARHEARGQEIAEIAVGALGRDRRNDDVARLDLLGDNVHHPIVAGVQENRDRRAGDERARKDRPHIGLHQPDAPHRLMHGRDAITS